ncbi:MAG: TonB-dependent siderophore receptor [Leptolyngbyaceae cyanobacterium]
MRLWSGWVSLQLAWILTLAGGRVLPAHAEGSVDELIDEPRDEIFEQFFSLSSQTLAQTSLVQITNVRLEETDAGLQIILETTDGELSTPTTAVSGNALIIEIANAVLTGDIFEQFESAEGIAVVQVSTLPDNRLQVVITGADAVPIVDISSHTAGVRLSVMPGIAEVGETVEPLRIVVTGEENEGYNPSNASTATRTDTPLRDIPQSIQVVPQQVLEDRQATKITDGLENVSGVILLSQPAGSRDNVLIRGFENFTGFLVNGIPDAQISSDGSFTNVEQLEVLKGPASVLFGQGPLGGVVNVITKQPLREPFYEVSSSAGSFNDYRGALDFSGPLNESGSALYRLNAAYREFDNFLDFDEGREFSVAPNFTFNLGPDTDFTVEGDANILERNMQQPEGQPAVGTVIPSPDGSVSRSFNAAGPNEDNLTINGRVGYRLKHRFNENLKLRNAFLYTFFDDPDSLGIFSRSLADDNRTLNRLFFDGSQFFDSYRLDTNLLGSFQTGSIEHQVLFGFDLARSIQNNDFEFGPAAPVDIFNPIFDQTVTPTGQATSSNITTSDTLGIYLQDQVTLAENLKLLVGGRFDTFSQDRTDRIVDEDTSQSDTAFSPRIGIVYQPSPAISLYASYARSFTPTIGTSADRQAFVPERGTQYEIGVKADINSRLSATLALYDLTRSNVTTSDPDNPFFQIQTGEQRSQGIELDMSGEILPNWNIVLGYAYNDARVTEDNSIPEGNRLRNAPQHALNLWTTYKIQQGDLQGLGFGLGFNYIDDRPGDLENTFEIPSYFRTDAAVFYERDQFRASLNFRNLFDIDYFASARSAVRVDPGIPFSVQGRVSWRF